jgi:hypothetical protein
MSLETAYLGASEPLVSIVSAYAPGAGASRERSR